MKQVLRKRGTITVEGMLAPIIEDNSVLVEVCYSLISFGIEISGLKTSGESLVRKTLKSLEKVKKILEHLKEKGILKQSLNSIITAFKYLTLFDSILKI